MEQRRRGSWWANLRLGKPGPAAIILMALVFMAQVGFYSKIRLNQACTIQTGSGTPEGTVTGAVCDLYLRTNGGTGTTLYVKESGSGNTGWAPAGSGTGSGTVVRKTADESVTSSTTLQNDDHLTVAIGASQVMAIRYILFVDAGATGDLKLGLSVPAGGTYRCGAGHVSNNVSSSFAVQATSTTSISVGGLGAGTIYEYVLDCTVVNSTTPGNVVLQFAQDVSDGTATTLKTNSVAMAGSPSGGGGGTTYSAGDGIDLTGDVINLVLDGTSLTKSGSGLKVTNPSGQVLVEQHTASSSSELVFTTCITSTYDDYEFRVVGALPATDGADLLVRFSTNGGSSYDSSGIYDRSHQYVATNNTTAFAGSVNQTSMDLGGDQDNGATGGLDATLQLANPLGTTQYKRMHGLAIYAHDSVGEIFIRRSVLYRNASAVNAVRFFYDTGNIATGTIRCYGVAK